MWLSNFQTVQTKQLTLYYQLLQNRTSKWKILHPEFWHCCMYVLISWMRTNYVHTKKKLLKAPHLTPFALFYCPLILILQEASFVSLNCPYIPSFIPFISSIFDVNFTYVTSPSEPQPPLPHVVSISKSLINYLSYFYKSLWI